MDALLLSRIQFAANISFHILFPSITIALAWVLLFFKIRYDVTRNMAWMQAYFTWVKVFALSFALGIVSGVTMSFQFGTNWPGFMAKTGNISGPLLAYEVLTAFFLEAVFLGIMLFGFRRVSNRMHTLATFLVAFGTTMSAFWILVLNSWMQTPVGFELRNGIIYPTDWLAIVFNPSFPYRFIHVILASGLTVSFLMAGLSSLRYLAGDRSESMLKALRTGVFSAAILIPVQIFIGDLHGLVALEHQPQKVAAIEANWETRANAPLVLFAWPDELAKKNHYELSIPNGASIILKHDRNGVVPGINEFADNHPPVFPVFWGFRIMVGVAFLMLIFSWIASFYLLRSRLFPRPLAFCMVPMAFSGWVASLSGWYVTEIGRQPWLVSGVLLTKDSVSTVPATHVAFTLAAYLLIYTGLIIAYISVLIHLMLKASRQGDPDLSAPSSELGSVDFLSKKSLPTTI